MLSADLRKKGVCSKYVRKTVYPNKFLVSENIFKLVYHCEGNRWSEICCARDITENTEQIFTVAYLKKQLTEVYCGKKCS